MQWDYYRSDDRKKQKIINELHEWSNTEIKIWIVIAVLVFLTAFYVLYPMIWFFYFWIYLNIVEGGDAVTAEYIAVWIIGGCYILTAVIVSVTVLILADKHGITMKAVNALVFEWSLSAKINGGIVSDAWTVYEQMPTVGSVLESTSLEFNIALIVLSYLYNKSESLSPILYDRRDSISSGFHPIRDHSPGSMSHSFVISDAGNERQSLLASDTVDGVSSFSIPDAP